MGTSDEYYLSPETSAGLPISGSDIVGGLPINPDTEKPITSDDLRDRDGNLKRQAARFRIFAYTIKQPNEKDTYPTKSSAKEIVKGDTLPDGRRVRDVIWTVHLANKKANAYNVVNAQGVRAYAKYKVDAHGKEFFDGPTVPQLRNPEEYGDGKSVDPETRVRKLVIDPGPRAIMSSEGGRARSRSTHRHRSATPTDTAASASATITQSRTRSNPSPTRCSNPAERSIPSAS